MARFSFALLRKLPAREKRITLPTLFTFVRIILTPCIVVSMVYEHWGAAFWLFVIAAATDAVDGALARLRNERTFLGACLDPIADKLLILSVFFTLAFVQSPLFSIPHWFVLFVLCKELLLVGGAVAIFAWQGHLEIRPTWLGKTTTLVQILFIVWLFACYFFAWVPIKTYYTMLAVVFVLVAASLMHYASIGFRTVLGIGARRS